MAVEHQVLVHLIGHHDQIPLDRHPCDQVGRGTAPGDVSESCSGDRLLVGTEQDSIGEA